MHDLGVSKNGETLKDPYCKDPKIRYRYFRKLPFRIQGFRGSGATQVSHQDFCSDASASLLEFHMGVSENRGSKLGSPVAPV